MNLNFESTNKFEKELKRFDPTVQTRIIKKLNQYCHLLPSAPSAFYKHACQPLKLALTGDNESTLYALKVSRDIRIIMMIDEDPLFDQIIITLLHVVRRSGLNKVFKGMAESIYQSHLRSLNEEGDM
jgi:mRNA-degrading endonuclease RelE of RelBE toxin-antitoxin system